MKKRFSKEQIVKILNEGETGTIKDICRRYGISDVTFSTGTTSILEWVYQK